MNRAFAFTNDGWKQIKAAYTFHHGFGFVKLNSVRVHDGTNWVTIELPDGSMTLVRRDSELVVA